MTTNSIIKERLPIRSQGMALVMALLVLLVMTFLGIAMLSSAGMQERMSGNQKRIADSSMAAEAGLQGHLSWLAEDPETNWDMSAGRPNSSASPDSFGYIENADDSRLARFYVEDWASFSDYDSDPATTIDECSPSDDTCVVTVVGESISGNQVLAQTRLRAILQYFPDEVPLGGAKDIWAGENIRINGNSYLTDTYMHSNGGVSEEDGDVTITGGRTTLENSRITANGDANINMNDDRCIDCSVTGDAGLNEPPPNISERVLTWLAEGEVTFGVFDPVTGQFDESSSEPQDSVNIGDFEAESATPNCSETFTFTEADFESGETYFVNGNVDISTSGGTGLENVTIISTCDMTHNGAMGQGGSAGEVNNIFYSAGEMIFNGSTGGNDPTPFVGRFFSGGTMTQNGKATLTGQIITSQSLDLNGDFSFTRPNSRGGNGDSEEGDGTVSLVNWSQVW